MFKSSAFRCWGGKKRVVGFSSLRFARQNKYDQADNTLTSQSSSENLKSNETLALENKTKKGNSLFCSCPRPHVVIVVKILE